MTTTTVRESGGYAGDIRAPRLLNLTGYPLDAHDYQHGAYEPGPFTDSVISTIFRGMTPKNAEDRAETIAGILTVENATGALIPSGPPWLVDALTAALIGRNIKVVTRYVFDIGRESRGVRP
jgi:hypothetical protein